MIGLLCFVLAVLASPFKSKIRLEAENAALRHQLIVLAAQGEGPRSAHEQRSLVLRPDVSMVSIDPEGRHDHPARNAGALASGRLSPLLALEIGSRGGRPQNRDGIARTDPADEHRRTSFGVRHASTANCSSSGLASLNQASPSTWSSDVDLQVRDGGPFCETTRRTLPPWICSWSRPLASNCCTAS